MNGPMLSLLTLAAEEEWTSEETAAEIRAASELSAFKQPSPDVNIIRPNHSDEPWRAEIREGKVPGENRHTSGFLVARRPSELLHALEKLFAEADPGAGAG